MNTKVHYSSDCEKMLFGDRIFEASYDQGFMEKDYGYFAAFQNPFHSEYRSILVHGIHTLGVVGAVKAFSDIVDAEYNYQMLLSRIDSRPMAFESFFSVDVFKGATICPEIEAGYIFPINTERHVSIQQMVGVTKYEYIDHPMKYQFLYSYIINLCGSIEQELPKHSLDSPKLYSKFQGYKKRLEQLMLSFNKPLTEKEIEIIKNEYENINREWSNKEV